MIGSAYSVKMNAEIILAKRYISVATMPQKSALVFLPPPLAY